ncbi:MAG: ROK family protein [Candidatus Nanopelagicales bacterium]
MTKLVTHAQSQTAVQTLAVDCGGGGIKGSVLDEAGQMLAERIRIPTPYPMNPDRFLDVLAHMTALLPPAHRATVGIPGMIRHGVVIATPHYITREGPYTAPDPELTRQWEHFNAQQAIEHRLGIPTLVVNDAEVHAADVATGVGFEVMFTLGTGLGCAILDNGILAPKLELSRAPIRHGVIYDEWVGEKARDQLGNKAWSQRVSETIEGLRPMFLWDRAYLGGGNAERLKVRFPPDITIVPNDAGITGGVRLWQMGNR